MIGQPVTAAWGGNKGSVILLGDSAGKVCHSRERTAVNQSDPWTQPTGPSTTAGRTHLEARHVCGEIKAVNLLVGDQGRDTASRGGGTGEEKYKAGKEGGTGDKVRDASERERPLKTREEKAAFGRLTPQLVSLLFFVCMQRTIQLFWAAREHNLDKD